MSSIILLNAASGVLLEADALALNPGLRGFGLVLTFILFVADVGGLWDVLSALTSEVISSSTCVPCILGVALLVLMDSFILSSVTLVL
jgi:hypothetical protein